MLNNIEAILKTESNKKGVSLNFNIDKLIPQYLSGDVNKLNRVLINIIGNAIKFTDKGEININVILSTKLTSNEVELLFSVKDTGIGIHKDQLRQVFERFSQADSSITRQYGGTGLGLSISKKLLEMMGGTIRAESELGKGSTFYFTIKLGIAQKVLPKIPEQTIAIQQETAKKYNVLLVEDAEDNRELIKLYLKKSPYNIDIAVNGAIAVEKIKQNKYDIILMDIQMPVMDGYTAISLTREWEKQNGLTPPLPIITITANAFKEDKEKSYAVGCSDYLTKPIKKTLLLETMNKYIKQEECSDTL